MKPSNSNHFLSTPSATSRSTSSTMDSITSSHRRLAQNLGRWESGETGFQADRLRRPKRQELRPTMRARSQLFQAQPPQLRRAHGRPGIQNRDRDPFLCAGSGGASWIRVPGKQEPATAEAAARVHGGIHAAGTARLLTARATAAGAAGLPAARAAAGAAGQLAATAAAGPTGVPAGAAAAGVCGSSSGGASPYVAVLAATGGAMTGEGMLAAAEDTWHQFVDISRKLAIWGSLLFLTLQLKDFSGVRRGTLGNSFNVGHECKAPLGIPAHPPAQRLLASLLCVLARRPC